MITLHEPEMDALVAAAVAEVDTEQPHAPETPPFCLELDCDELDAQAIPREVFDA